MDLDKISTEMEDALERARLLAERREQGTITPLHMLYVLIDADGALAGILDRAGVARKALLDSLAARINQGGGVRKLDPGKPATASRTLPGRTEVFRTTVGA